MVGKVTPDDMLSASRLPAVMGLSRYRTPNDELEASIQHLQGIERPELADPEPAYWGNLLEPVVLKEACLRTGIDNLELNHPFPYFHLTWPLCCSLDGDCDGRGKVIQHNPDQGIIVDNGESIVLDGPGVLEAKVTSVRPEASLDLARGPVQLQGQLAVTCYNWGMVVVLYGGNRLKCFFFRRHEPTMDLIKAAAYDFDRRVKLWKNTGELDLYPPAEVPEPKPRGRKKKNG